jgi:hypothetical protein
MINAGKKFKVGPASITIFRIAMGGEGEKR